MKRTGELYNNPELYFAKQKAKKRDFHKCQWYGCELKSWNTEVHAHHCLTQKKYPEEKNNPQYMITYCIYHHILWHKLKGENYEAAQLWRRMLMLMNDGIKCIPNIDIQYRHILSIGDGFDNPEHKQQFIKYYRLLYSRTLREEVYVANWNFTSHLK